MSKVLVVEDDESTSELIKYTLEIKGFTVDQANDGGIAMKKVRTNTPDLILLDIMLPTVDGYQVCEMLKHHNIFQNIPIIMLSAKIRREDVSAGLEKGADEYMTKPFEPDKLIERIQFHLTNKTEKKEN